MTWNLSVFTATASARRPIPSRASIVPSKARLRKIIGRDGSKPSLLEARAHACGDAQRLRGKCGRISASGQKPKSP